MYWFMSDEHINHEKMLLPEYCNRAEIMQVVNVEEMNRKIINNHNEVVEKNDIVIHAGDTCWCKTYQEAQEKYISKLNGNHIFIKGSHDRWLPSSAKCRWRKMLDGQFVVVDHYAGRTWERAHYGSWQLYGHWHSEQENIGLQYNICVDLNNFYPVSLDEVKEIMINRAEVK